MNKKLPIIIILVIGLLGLFYFYQKYKVAPTINFEGLSLSNLNNEPVQFDNIIGKKTIVCFSASWCPNCINELNALKKIHENELNDIQIVVIDDEPLEQIERFKNKREYPFLFLKLNDPFSDIGIYSIPVTYFFDKNGLLKKEVVGEINWDDLSTREHYKSIME